MTNSELSPVIYLPHGAGPLPVLGAASQQALADFLVVLPSRLQRPDAIVMVSAHWENDPISVTAGDSPSLIYDYSGFPDESYQFKYPAAGSPELAAEISFELNESGIACNMDKGRGYDHGMFVPLMLMYPGADIPCVQLSLNRNLDPEFHINMGKALSFLRQKNIMIIGSGLSYHNMQGFSDQTSAMHQANRQFDNWIIETCCDPTVAMDEREARLKNWSRAPGAMDCHPREEHLIPLHVCFGASEEQGSPATVIFNDAVSTKIATGLLW